MNRVWKIIEERKSGMSESGMRGGYSSRKSSSGMSGRKGGEYEEGVKDGLCAALDILEDYVKEFDKE